MRRRRLVSVKREVQSSEKEPSQPHADIHTLNRPDERVQHHQTLGADLHMLLEGCAAGGAPRQHRALATIARCRPPPPRCTRRIARRPVGDTRENFPRKLELLRTQCMRQEGSRPGFGGSLVSPAWRACSTRATMCWWALPAHGLRRHRSCGCAQDTGGTRHAARGVGTATHHTHCEEDVIPITSWGSVSLQEHDMMAPFGGSQWPRRGFSLGRGRQGARAAPSDVG